MINLLPPLEKTKRAQEKRLKLVWILGILISASLISFSLILLAIKCHITNQANTYRAIIDFERERTSPARVLQNKVNAVNGTLAWLDSFYEKQFVLVDFIERITGLLQSDIYLKNFSYNTEDSRVAFSGYTSTIDKVYELREKLKAQKDFTGVNLTIPDWLQSSNINFTVTFILNK